MAESAKSSGDSENLAAVVADGEGSSSDKPCETVADKDDELDALLDSALEDFDRPPTLDAPTTNKESSATPPQPAHRQTDTQASSSKLQASTQDASPAQQEALFNDLFSAAERAQGQGPLEDMMKGFMTEQPELMQQLEQMMSGAGPGFGPGGGPDSVPGVSGNFEETLQNTLGSLAQNIEELQGDVPPDDELMRLLSGLRLDEGDGAEPSLPADLEAMPMMQSMLQSLMSKDVLYPPLKDLTTKYPGWLEKNASQSESETYQNYRRQYDLMQQIVSQFEEERSDDSESVKAARFTRIMDLMHSMQALGHPPKELVGDMPAGMEFDANGMPKFPGSPEQCSVM